MAREMKDSCIPWIYNIPNDWKIMKMNMICSLVTDFVASGSFADLAKNVEYLDEPDYAMLIRTADVSNKGHISKPVYINKHAYDFLSNSNLFGGELLFPNIGGIGDVYIVPKLYERMSLAPNAIICKTHYYDKYYYYYFNCEAGRRSLIEISQSTAQAKFNKTDFRQIRALVPSIQEQQSIADFLDTQCAHIDSVIEKTHTAIEEYKKLKQAVITQAVTKGIRPNREMKDSGIEWIGTMPKDWLVMPSKWLFYNSDLRKQDGDEQMTASQQYGIITQKKYMELTGSKVVFANKGLEDWKHVEPNDFIISLRSFQGGLEMSESTGCITWHYIVLKPRKEIISYYYKWLFKSEMYIKALQRTCNYIRDGQDLRYSNFVQVPLVEPSLIEQKEIADFLNEKTAAIDSLIQKKEQLIKELDSYKKSLIYEYVTGKKEVV